VPSGTLGTLVETESGVVELSTVVMEGGKPVACATKRPRGAPKPIDGLVAPEAGARWLAGVDVGLPVA
jgi:hypothetical protein